MKNLKTILPILLIFLFTGSSFSQVLSESARRKVTIGADFFTDIWQGAPVDMDLRTIHQGFNIFAMYNFQLGESEMVSFSAGLGIDNHNMYSNTRIDNITADTIVFTPIEEVYERCKINLTYASLPLELKIKLNSGVKFGAGFKVRYLLSSKEKYIGDLPGQRGKTNLKRKPISQTEDWAYGFTLRVGYKSFNLFGYYQISKIFENGKGPQMYPISVGLTLTPF